MEQVEVAIPTAPTRVADQTQPPGAIYPQIELLAGKLHYLPAPKPTTSRDMLDSDSDQVYSAEMITHPSYKLI